MPPCAEASISVSGRTGRLQIDSRDSSRSGLGRAAGASTGLTDERQPVEALAQRLVGETREHALHHADRVGGGPARRLFVAVPGVERRERTVRSPELRRVADLVGDRPGFLERAPRVLPAPRRAGSLARETPGLDQILARVRAGGEIQAPARVTRGGAEIPPRKRQLALTRGEPDRVAEAHP